MKVREKGSSVELFAPEGFTNLAEFATTVGYSGARIRQFIADKTIPSAMIRRIGRTTYISDDMIEPMREKAQSKRTYTEPADDPQRAMVSSYAEIARTLNRLYRTFLTTETDQLHKVITVLLPDALKRIEKQYATTFGASLHEYSGE